MIFFSCKEKDYSIKINKKDVKLWESINSDYLYQNCKNFKSSGSEIILLRTFNRDVRTRILKKIKFLDKINKVEFFESYGIDNNNLIDVIIGSNLISFNYEVLNDTITFRKNLKKQIIGYKDKSIIEKIMKTENIDCSSMNWSHPALEIFSVLKIQNNEIEVIETHIR